MVVYVKDIEKIVMKKGCRCLVFAPEFALGFALGFAPMFLWFRHVDHGCWKLLYPNFWLLIHYTVQVMFTNCELWFSMYLAEVREKCCWFVFLFG